MLIEIVGPAEIEARARPFARERLGAMKNLAAQRDVLGNVFLYPSTNREHSFYADGRKPIDLDQPQHAPNDGSCAPGQRIIGSIAKCKGLIASEYRLILSEMPNF